MSDYHVTLTVRQGRIIAAMHSRNHHWELDNGLLKLT